MKIKTFYLLLLVSGALLSTNCKKSSKQQYVFVVEKGTITDKAGIHSSSPQVVESISPGAKVKMTYNPTSHLVKIDDFDVYFSSANFKSVDGAKGGVQLIRFSISGLEASLDSKTGKITGKSSACYYIQAAELMGGKGLLCVGNIDETESALEDKNSPSFDLSNGLGCGGKLKLSLYFGNATPPIGVQLEAKLLQEDLDGDNKFDNTCLPPKDFEILYEPPKLRIVFPGPLYPAQYGDIYAIQHLKIDELIKGANPNVDGDTMVNEISGLIFDNSSYLQIVIFDSNKNVVMGDLSDSDTKSFDLDMEVSRDHYIGIMPRIPMTEKSYYDFP